MFRLFSSFGMPPMPSARLVFRLLFASGLLVRLGAMPWFGGEIARHLFIPFLRDAAFNLDTNPWLLHFPEAFPYGFTLFGIEIISFFLARLFVPAGLITLPAVSLVPLNLPLLLLDLLMFASLLKRIVSPLSRNLERIVMTIEGELLHQDITAIAHELIPSPKPITKFRQQTSWRSGIAGLNQLVTLLLIEQRLSAS
jgi:hypothetical protein